MDGFPTVLINVKLPNGQSVGYENWDNVLKSSLILFTRGAIAIDDIAQEHPSLVNYSLVALQLALSGPVGFVRDTVFKHTGIQEHVDKALENTKDWVSQRLQQELGLSKGKAELLTAGAGFGMMFALSSLGGESKDKVLECARDVSEKVKIYMTYYKLHSKGKAPYWGRTSGFVKDLKDRNQLQSLVDKRNRNHHMDKKQFGPGKVDKVSLEPEPIRGLEQRRVEQSGGAQSSGGTSSNKINPIAPKNPNKPRYNQAAINEFGE